MWQKFSVKSFKLVRTIKEYVTIGKLTKMEKKECKRIYKESSNIGKKTYKEYFRSRYSSSKRDTMIKMYKNNLDPDNKLNNNIMYSEDGNDDPDSTNGYDPD